jgi:hypothetical protein
MVTIIAIIIIMVTIIAIIITIDILIIRAAMLPSS